MVNGVELFAGGGGLLLGSSLAGVNHVAAVEWDRWACQTMRENSHSDYPLVRGLQVLEGDVRTVEWSSATKGLDVDVVTGGPPCQPFSMGGRARAADDPRDMFPAMTDVIAELRPRAFVVENVKGLTRAAFSDYLEFIKLRLQHPLLVAREGETWVEHFTRLQKEHTQSHEELRYNIVPKLVNAADYGVPQHRHRIFLVGFRSDVDAEWSFPEATHSGAALALAQQSGEYWERWDVPKDLRHQIRRRPDDDGMVPWKTVREALAGMPTPGQNGTPGWMDHKHQPGARSYPGHTGSPYDEPSKTLKAGGHGVPGGENMIRYPDGRIRYYSVREAARIQTFPDRYALHGAWGEAMRQIGNAVPVLLAEKVMGSVVEHLELDSGKRAMSSVRHLRAVS